MQVVDPRRLRVEYFIRTPKTHLTERFHGKLPRARQIGYDMDMSTVELHRKIKSAVDRLPPERLESLADYVRFLDQPPLMERVAAAEKAIAAGKGVNWRKVRSDV